MGKPEEKPERYTPRGFNKVFILCDKKDCYRIVAYFYTAKNLELPEGFKAWCRWCAEGRIPPEI